MKMSIELAEFIKFRKAFDGSLFKHQRFGQAFYNHFQLHKLSNQEQFKNLYELNELEAMEIIDELYEFT